jgi:hypothetical protein
LDIVGEIFVVEATLQTRPRRIDRVHEPTILTLEQTIDWIKQERPLIWFGSIFSVPSPSGMPSGAALTESILNLVFKGALHKDQKDSIIRQLLPQWPLEALFDEFETLGFDISYLVLNYFNQINKSASPNPLHHAIANYYRAGFARKPLCLTTNWDTLQESAFRQAGYSVKVAGPAEYPTEGFGEPGSDPNLMFVYHPHGSFDNKDAVCSFRQQQRGLMLPLIQWVDDAILYLGYSGYEPSLYHMLENGKKQLWCIRDMTDLEIPAKRRLLCRPNTFIFVGDVRELLKGLGVLQEEINLKSLYLENDDPLPARLIETIRTSVFASLSPITCSELICYNLLSFNDEPEASAKYTFLMRALVNHVRNRVLHPALLLSLLAAARFRDTESTWITILAYQLRLLDEPDPTVIERLLHEAGQAASLDSSDDERVYLPLMAKTRCQIYRSFVGHGDKLDREELRELIERIALYHGDLAAYGELLEILAFEYLHDGQHDMARRVFDAAATSFYLRGLWNAGRVNEWASNNIDRLVRSSRKNSLVIPTT